MTHTHSNSRRGLLAVATIAGLAGAVVVAWSIATISSTRPGTEQAVIAVLLFAAALICARTPIRMGLGESFLTLDSIPFVLAAVLLPTELGVVIVASCVAAAMVGQPVLEGWLGRFWQLQVVLSSGLAMFGASEFAAWIDRSSTSTTLLVPAFAVALVLEASFDLLVVIELESEERGAGMAFLKAWPPLAANVFLPTAAVAMLTPYVQRELWQFALLLPVLLVAMYGALWVANSQQLEKRRGDRLKDTFSRYVPEGIVDDNIETMQEIELGGEQADLSVLFCDIRGFTSWAEDKGATEVVHELNVLLTELSAAVMDNGGTLDKFTGDGLMAFWGAPVAMDDHADRASRAALEMLRKLEAVNDRRREQGHEPFAIGVAVHSGPAVVGNVGHERRLDYTAIGDTVNTTARLEASTKELGAVLLVSRATVDLLGDELRARAMRIGEVEMKGKARSVEAWALQPLRPELDGLDDEFAA